MHLLLEGAADGALLIEITFGPATILQPDFMALFREAERRVQAQFPKLRAEALIAGTQPTNSGAMYTSRPASRLHRMGWLASTSFPTRMMLK